MLMCSNEMADLKRNRDDIVRQIRDVGESLIKNAESIAGTETYLTGIDIYVDIDVDGDVIPEIHIERKFIPEQRFDRQED